MVTIAYVLFHLLKLRLVAEDFDHHLDIPRDLGRSTSPKIMQQGGIS
jgi:hypothetical protein